MNEQVPVSPRGLCHALFAFDVGQMVDLEACKDRLRTVPEPVRFRHNVRAPSYFQFNPEPLRLVDSGPRGDRWNAGPPETVLYDFGAVSVTYAIPFQGSLEELVELSNQLEDDAALQDQAREHVRRLLELLGGAVTRMRLEDTVESYLIFEVPELPEGLSPEQFVDEHRGDLARILRAEHDPLSGQEIEESLSHRASFSRDDVAVVDWNASLILGRDPEDVRAVLEFANVQLLEMRFLDQQLDGALDRAYDLVARRSWAWFGVARRDLLQVGTMQVDSAVLFESVYNSLKLLGDPFLGRVYRLAADRFRLTEWNQNFRRKLDVLDDIYEKLHDRAATKRMELLEWIIIVLIAVSALLPFAVG